MTPKGNWPLPTEPRELLCYVAEYRVLICQPCGYAVQPTGLSRHLKEIHKIHSANREIFLDYADTLDLQQPEAILLPKEKDDTEPIPFLPIVDGLACGIDGCRHLCATGKRMKMHYRAVHPNVTPTDLKCSAVHLQTFFRGNQLRYFAVRRKPSPPTSESERDAGLEPRCTREQVAGDVDMLLKHFRAFLSAEFARNSISASCWDVGPSGLPAKYPFLKHGILSCAALHLAYLNGTQRRLYRFMAARHQNIALPSFRSAVEHPTVDNCLALLAFTELLVIHCFAASRDSDIDSDTGEDSLLLVQGRSGPFPDWLRVLRGSCYIFKPVEAYVMSLPKAAMVFEGYQPANLTTAARNAQLETLFGIFTTKPAAQEPQHPALLSALNLLLHAFALAETSRAQGNYTLNGIVHIWPVQVPDEYLELLKKRHPIALILLAHYALLFLPLEGSWYMEGYSRRLMTRINAELDDEWKTWLTWPLEQVECKAA